MSSSSAPQLASTRKRHARGGHPPREVRRPGSINAAAARCWSSQGKCRFDRRSTKPHRTPPRPSRDRRSGDDGRAGRSPSPSPPGRCAASRRDGPGAVVRAGNGTRTREDGQGPSPSPRGRGVRARAAVRGGHLTAPLPVHAAGGALRRRHRATASPESSRAQERRSSAVRWGHVPSLLHPEILTCLMDARTPSRQLPASAHRSVRHTAEQDRRRSCRIRHSGDRS